MLLVFLPLLADAIVVNQHAVQRSLQAIFVGFVALDFAVVVVLVALAAGRRRRRRVLRSASVTLSACALAAVGYVVVVGESGDFSHLEHAMLVAGSLIAGVSIALIVYALSFRRMPDA